jgi:hypothetical protein
VLGQRVSVDVTTVFDDNLVGGLAGLTPGSSLVQVYAVFDPALATYRASRIEPASTLAEWHLRGPLSADADTGAKALRVGSITYSYLTATSVPASLAAGQFVRLTLAAGSPAGSFRVVSFGTALQPLADADELEFKGLVSSFTSISNFSVNGRPVNASAAGVTGVALGARVKVEGAVSNGILRATKVTVVTDQEEQSSPFELHGNVESLDAGAKTFLIRKTTIGYGSATFSPTGKKAADLAALPAPRVKVKGMLSADGRRVEATEIEFEDK